LTILSHLKKEDKKLVAIRPHPRLKTIPNMEKKNNEKKKMMMMIMMNQEKETAISWHPKSRFMIMGSSI
jgi:hypothetical protein